jgi:hypothetical protein
MSENSRELVPFIVRTTMQHEFCQHRSQYLHRGQVPRYRWQMNDLLILMAQKVTKYLVHFLFNWQLWLVMPSQCRTSQIRHVSMRRVEV